MKFSFENKQFIEQQIYPDKIAIIGDDTFLTWHQFENEVSKFCSYLKSETFDKIDSPVIIFGHKEVEMIVAIYSCIQLNIPYIPIDEVYPIDRVKKIQELANVKLIINCSKNILSLPNCSELNYLNFQAKEVYKQDCTYSNERNKENLVYIIFTSGSTGEPKGVQISNEAVISFQKWMTTSFGFTASDVFVNVALFSFDLSVYELLTFASLGSTLLLNSKKYLTNPDEFLNRIEKNKGSILVSTPSFSFIFSRSEFQQIKNNIRYFLFCGEVLPHKLAQKLKSSYPDTVIYNTYGPTEATVATTLIEINEEILSNYNPLPVGYPKLESEIMIEDDEIIIVGKNVSIGYLNRPDLNQLKFVIKNNQRAFKTGDLGYIEAGMLFCKGRNDNQVKLHGYRIELEEITEKLKEIQSVENSATIALKHQGETKKIVSFIVSNQPCSKEKISLELSTLLPYYMIPSDFVFLKELPMNTNGKIDTNRLLEIYLTPKN